MKTTHLFAALVTSLAISPAFAQATDPAYTLTGNAGLTSEYRFRGFAQTNFRPAFQGGVDFAHSSGLYLGNWNSNVDDDLYGGGSLEMDFYGGYKGKLGDFGYDVGLLYYYYPGSDGADGDTIDNTEVYVGGSYGPLSVKYFHGLSNFFGAPGTKNTHYLDVGLAFDLGNGWGANAHVGYQKLKKAANADGEGISGYYDYKLGVTKDLNGWLAGLSLVSSSKQNWYLTDRGHPAGRLGVLASINKSF